MKGPESLSRWHAKYEWCCLAVSTNCYHLLGTSVLIFWRETMRCSFFGWSGCLILGRFAMSCVWKSRGETIQRKVKKVYASARHHGVHGLQEGWAEAHWEKTLDGVEHPSLDHSIARSIWFANKKSLHAGEKMYKFMSSMFPGKRTFKDREELHILVPYLQPRCG